MKTEAGAAEAAVAVEKGRKEGEDAGQGSLLMREEIGSAGTTIGEKGRWLGEGVSKLGVVLWLLGEGVSKLDVGHMYTSSNTSLLLSLT
jgi:hypothetical protein